MESTGQKSLRWVSGYMSAIHRLTLGRMPQIYCDGYQHYLGMYNSPEEAARVYDAAARAHHGMLKSGCESGCNEAHGFYLRLAYLRLLRLEGYHELPR